MDIQRDHHRRIEHRTLHRKVDAQSTARAHRQNLDGCRCGIRNLLRITKRDRLFREADEVGERLMNKLEIIVRIDSDKFSQWMASMTFVDETDRLILETFRSDLGTNPSQYVMIRFGRHIE